MVHFLTFEQAQSEPFQTEYRYRIVTTLSVFLLCMAISIAAGFGAYLSWVEDTMTGVVFLGWIAFWFALFTLILHSDLRARLRPTNWLVRTQTSGMLIKFRSYLNYHFDPIEPAVIRINYGDIEFARPHRVRQKLPGLTAGDDYTKFTRSGKCLNGADSSR